LKAAITGGAGFIGSALARSLVLNGWDVSILDNLTSGSKDNLAGISTEERLEEFEFVVGDCRRPGDVRKAIQDADTVLHLAANPEVRMELNSPEVCFEQNIYATYNVLEAFRQSKAETIVFASTSTVYGEAKTIPTPETYSPLEPISVYGASKLAGEALVCSYCHAFGKQGIILRLANVVGPNSKHGVVSEFSKALRKNPKQLLMMGNGTQNKSYVYIDDCIEAVQLIMKSTRDSVAVFNIGSEDSISVKQIGETVVQAMGLTDVQLRLNGGLEDGRGWIGDVKLMLLDVTKLKSFGWIPKFNSQEAIEQTVKGIIQRQEIQ
jgi:UDP-glucose 4-epimerase